MRKVKLETTFALLRKHNACESGYHKLAKFLGGVKKYGETTPINLLTVLYSNSLDDALWCLRAVLPDQTTTRDCVARLFAADCAEVVLPIFEKKYPDDKRPRQAITAARAFAAGKISAKELDAASVAARAAAWDAAWGAAWGSQTELFRKYLSWERS